jgi:uncharacterized protein YndB with AHSA1/START domain
MSTISSITVEIAAPAAFVWDILVDYPHYPQWNPYTVRVDTTLEIGSPIDLTLPSPDGAASTFVNREYIRVVDPPHHLRYDTGDAIPGLFAVRDQWIEPRGRSACAYHTTDTMTGELAPWVIKSNGDWVKAGFDAVARALKKRAETLWESAA